METLTECICSYKDGSKEKPSKIKTKKTFKPTHIPRYLRGQVKERLLKTDLENYNKHRRNVFYVKPIVDCKPPPMNPNVYCNTKRLEIDEHRVRQINQENVEMVKRINKINRFGSNLDTFNRLAYVRNKEWWELHKKEMQRIVVDNRKIYVSIKKAKSDYLSKNYDEFWNRVLRKLQNTTKYPLILFDKKPLDVLVREQRSISDGQCVEEKPRCFMDFRVKDGVYLGRIVIELYHNYVPVTVQNFLSICSNQDGLTYKHSEIHKIYANSHMDLGDITKGNGKGGISIYGDTFAEENHVLKHTRMGVLSMIPVKPKMNNSQFCITFKEMETFDKSRVVFGKVIIGNNTLCKLNDLGRKFGKPIAPIIIENCGTFIKGETCAQIRNFKYNSNLRNC